MSTLDTAVVIVGGGPTGLSLAALLRRQGVDCVVVERDSSTCDHPQAHIVNTRSMEILRLLDLDQAVLAQALPPTAGKVRWITAIAGEELACLDLLSDPARVIARMTASPTVLASCAQDRVEPLLAEKVRDSGGEIRFASEVTSLTDEGDRVCARVRGPKGWYDLCARYAVACDGAGSRTRKALGVEMQGLGALGHVVNVYFHADLSAWTDDRAAILYWILNAVSPGVLIAIDGRERWAFHTFYDGACDTLEKYTPAVCERMVRAAIGADVAVDVRSIKPWTMTAEVATSYRRGNIFLAGDAAHRFPPTGGFGMNTGIQDAHNLAWKFAAVLAGRAGEKLLDTYEAEREPVAQANTQWSVANAIGMAEISGPGAIEIASHLASGELTLGKASSFIQATADREIGHFDSLALDLGFRYQAGAVVGAESSDSAAQANGSHREFTPDSQPGSRAPHVWLARGGKNFSILDLFDDRFILMTGADHATFWRSAVADARRSSDIEVVHVGDGGFEDVDGSWTKLYAIEGGAILIRPDGHIAWRCASSGGGDAAALSAALRTILPE